MILTLFHDQPSQPVYIKLWARLHRHSDHFWWIWRLSKDWLSRVLCIDLLAGLRCCSSYALSLISKGILPSEKYIFVHLATPFMLYLVNVGLLNFVDRAIFLSFLKWIVRAWVQGLLIVRRNSRTLNFLDNFFLFHKPLLPAQLVNLWEIFCLWTFNAGFGYRYVWQYDLLVVGLRLTTA